MYMYVYMYVYVYIYVRGFEKRGHFAHIVKIEILPLRNSTLNADCNGSFRLPMRCSVVEL